MVQNGPNDHFGQNALIPNSILAFARPKWTKMVHFGPFWPEEVHFGPFRSANRTLAIPKENRHSLAILHRKDIAHLGVVKTRAISRGEWQKSLRATRMAKGGGTKAGNLKKPSKIPCPDLPFLAFLENGKENHQKSKDFLFLANP